MIKTTTTPRFNAAVVARFVLDVVVVVVFAAAGYVALSWPVRGAVLPLTASGIGLILGAFNLYRDVTRIRSEGYDFITTERGASTDEADTADGALGPDAVPAPDDIEKIEHADREGSSAAEEDASRESEEFRLGLRYLTLLFVFLVMLYVGGARAAAPLFVGLFLWRESDLSWPGALLGAVGVFVLITVLQQTLGLRMPSNLLGL